ncbi:MAG: radical SAM family heme chaperone HemW [Herpetosiphonaceae bacterium]|nr:radical SAM family heme chaperone HemW [Herpetosiphonaceae bacterium]
MQTSTETSVYPDLKHLYVHIPFCQTRCAYCDFNTFANREDFMTRYVAALCTHLERIATSQTPPSPDWPSTAADLQPTVRFSAADVAAPLRRADLPRTVFLGGGTPTALPIALLDQVMQRISTLLPLDEAEVTSEANPGTVLGDEYLRAMRGMGINRISMGVQSLDDPTLRVLGRIHTAAEARSSYETARRVGFDNINLDFIFGLPGQDIGQWEAALRELVRWDVDHLALYSLIIEPGTPLAGQVAAGRVVVPTDDATADMYERAIDILGSAGYIQYEISNWARPGNPALAPAQALPAYASRHNVAYWLNADYLGVGAGAHSHSRRLRWADERVLETFARRVGRGEAPIAETTPLVQSDVEGETMMMGLRLSTGVGYRHFQERCGRSLEEAFAAELAELVAQELLVRDAHGVRLTERGRMLGNNVFARFLA